eukprot:CAMPEP_0196660346 /NCGR_PEP_ID=MMETSP1086-20130531/39204_1 /TAXON_ID=77921 /ORGANISM="Cyanoptyche  gloeocystis , Strain SAG4.97" /LENGTH=234 /DNA_ID=CAMNT_0041994691 /DNA_START=223 /DNA_END=927 /DNA_ORIENTATION=-
MAGYLAAFASFLLVMATLHTPGVSPENQKLDTLAAILFSAMDVTFNVALGILFVGWSLPGPILTPTEKKLLFIPWALFVSTDIASDLCFLIAGIFCWPRSSEFREVLCLGAVRFYRLAYVAGIISLVAFIVAMVHTAKREPGSSTRVRKVVRRLPWYWLAYQIVRLPWSVLTSAFGPGWLHLAGLYLIQVIFCWYVGRLFRPAEHMVYMELGFSVDEELSVLDQDDDLVPSDQH